MRRLKEISGYDGLMLLDGTVEGNMVGTLLGKSLGRAVANEPTSGEGFELGTRLGNCTIRQFRSNAKYKDQL